MKVIAEKVVDFLIELIRMGARGISVHFKELFLVGLFFGGAFLLVRWGANPQVSDWVQKGVVIGAILLLIQGKGTSNPPSVNP